MKTKIVQTLWTIILGVILLGSATQPGFASAPAQPNVQKQTNSQPASSIDPVELELFLDDLMDSQMAENHIPGTVVAIVKDGSLLMAKGYGYADLEGQVPVDPERTLFRVGSVSKLITWTAVMQLLEQGKLSLDTDVNQYLDFTIPATFPEPITMRHLMSHTPGFEDQDLTFYKLRAELVSPLDVYLKANVPARVFPPGKIPAYSNYGAALAGYIVERISGLPFNDYVEQNIFTPLGMVHSTFRQPLPENLAVDLATGYNYTRGQYVASSYVYDQAYPGGSMSTTATDMARFMIAHLQNGELGGKRILQEETAVKMHTQLYSPDPRLNGGIAHGFFEDTINGQRLLSHNGSLITYISNLHLIPEQNIGIFISTNSTSGTAPILALADAFIDRFYPSPEPAEMQSPAGFAGRIAPYLGEYTLTRRNFTSFEKMSALMGPVQASLENDDTLIISVPGRKLRFVETEPGLLEEIGVPVLRQLIYRTDPDGRKFLMNGSVAMFRTPWYGTVTLHWILFVSGTLLFMAALIAWPIGFFAGRRQTKPDSKTAPLPARTARWAAALFGLLWLVSLLGIASIFANILPGFGIASIEFETPPQLNILLSFTYVLISLAVAILVFAVLAWLKHYWSLGGRIFYTLLALMALLLSWALVYWGLLL